jgi:hypothetical protein
MGPLGEQDTALDEPDGLPPDVDPAHDPEPGAVFVGYVGR